MTIDKTIQKLINDHLWRAVIELETYIDLRQSSDMSKKLVYLSKIHFALEKIYFDIARAENAED